VNGAPGRAHTTYRITTITGHESGAGTDANVWMTLIGVQGKLEKVKLDNDSNNFETGKVDVFKAECLDLGDLKQVIIGHDNSGLGPDWLLDKVYVADHDTGQRWVFPCNKWIGSGKDDGKLERTLLPGDTSKTTFMLKIWTATEQGAGTDANVYCTIFGTNGDTGKVELKKSLHHMNKFESGHMDEFVIDSKVLGNVTHLVIGHDSGGLTAGIFGKGASNAWLMDKAELMDQLSGIHYAIACGQWFDKKKGDGKTERKLEAKVTTHHSHSSTSAHGHGDDKGHSTSTSSTHSHGHSDEKKS